MNGSVTLLSILGGVALLLYGISLVRKGMTRAYGGRLRRVIALSTKNKVSGFMAGMTVASLLQSGMATILIVASFAARHLITLGGGLAVVLGADVGVTIVAQVLSFDIHWLAPALLLGGVVGHKVFSSGRGYHLSKAVIGLGIILFALTFVKSMAAPLSDSAAVQTLMESLSKDIVLLFILTALTTWVLHSSLTMVLLIMSFVEAGLFSMEAGFVCVLGANAGATIAPLVMNWAAGFHARSVALGNMIMRGGGAMIALPLAAMTVPIITGIDDSPMRAIANFHTAYNLSMAMVALPLTGFLAKILERFAPDPGEDTDPAQPHYLDENEMSTPSVALASLRREVLRLGELVEGMLITGKRVFMNNDAEAIERVHTMEDTVDRLSEAIKLYVTKMSSHELDPEESRKAIDMLQFSINLEHAADVINNNLMDHGRSKIDNHLTFSTDGKREILAYYDIIMENFKLALNVFTLGDRESAQKLITRKREARRKEIELSNGHLNRLKDRTPETLETTGLHLDIIRDLRRINSHLASVGYGVVEQN
jgi:phosphate:Na+ symporter